jgi:hypothetical protein
MNRLIYVGVSEWGGREGFLSKEPLKAIFPNLTNSIAVALSVFIPAQNPPGDSE